MEDSQQAVNETVETAVESPATEQPVEASTEVKETTAEVTETKPTEPTRSRASERISELTGKVKSLSRELEETRGRYSTNNQNAQQQEWPPQLPQVKPIDQQVLDEEGNLDLNRLNSYIIQQAEAINELSQAKRDAYEKHSQSVSRWAGDLENTHKQIMEDFKDDPDLIEEVSSTLADQLEELNEEFYKSNGQQSPRVNASQIYKTLKKAVNTAQAKARQKTQASLERISEEGALRSSQTVESDDGYTEADIWNDPDKIINKLGKKLKG